MSLIEILNAKKLTKRELQVFYFILQGMSHKEIASKLNIQYKTSKFHTTNILNKLEARTKLELVIKYCKLLGWEDINNLNM